MQKWLISVDTEKFDIHEYFTKSKCINWIQRVHYEVGDIVYIYCKMSIGKVMYKTVVEDESLHFDDNEDKFAVLRFVEYVDTDDLSFENLKLHGLKIAPMNAMKIQDDLEDYIDKYFNNGVK